MIYQYMRGIDATRDCLLNRRLKVSKASALNDPFEWSPGVSSDTHPEAVFSQWQRLHQEYPTSVPPADRAHVLHLQLMAAKKATVMQESIRAHAEAHSRLLCFSERLDGALLWAHYANKHEGFAVGFNAGKLQEMSPLSQLEKVEYSNERIVFSSPYEAPLDEKKFCQLLKRKSTDWNGEQEVRLFVDISHLKPQEGEFNGSLYLPIVPEALACVIFGFRSEVAHREELYRLAAGDPELRHVEFLQAHLHPTRFEIFTEPFSQ